MDKEFFMIKAIEQARIAKELLEVPIGAVIVKDGKIVGRGYNNKETNKNAILHAEINAIEDACRNLGGWRLIDCSMFVTLEPCPMCAGAIVNSRINKVYIGCKDYKSGACGTVMNIANNINLNHRCDIEFNILEKECSSLISSFFKDLRSNKKIKIKQ